MGIVDLYNDKYSLEFIEQKLNKVGMTIDDSEEWEVHGPHEDMNYQVYVGPANFDKVIWGNTKFDGLYVAVCDKGVFDVEDMNNWNLRTEDNKVCKPRYV
jgi:hypothetical protein